MAHAEIEVRTGLPFFRAKFDFIRQTGEDLRLEIGQNVIKLGWESGQGKRRGSSRPVINVDLDGKVKLVSRSDGKSKFTRNTALRQDQRLPLFGSIEVKTMSLRVKVRHLK